MELSKTYNCFFQDLLITKLEAHGVSKKSVMLNEKLLRILSTTNRNRFHIEPLVKLSYARCPTGLVLGPLFFKIFINDIFAFIEKIQICIFVGCQYDL